MITNIMYVQQDGVVIRLAQHACHCDECKLLDAQDLESLRLAHEYLEKKLDFDAWWDAQILNSMGEKDVAINRFNMAMGSKTGPNGLATMIDCLYWSFNEHDRGEFDEKRFRELLECFIEGYETRMRTVHLWRMVEAGQAERGQ